MILLLLREMKSRGKDESRWWVDDGCEEEDGFERTRTGEVRELEEWEE